MGKALARKSQFQAQNGVAQHAALRVGEATDSVSNLRGQKRQELIEAAEHIYQPNTAGEHTTGAPEKPEKKPKPQIQVQNNPGGMAGVLGSQKMHQRAYDVSYHNNILKQDRPTSQDYQAAIQERMDSLGGMPPGIKAAALDMYNNVANEPSTATSREMVRRQGEAAAQMMLNAIPEGAADAVRDAAMRDAYESGYAVGRGALPNAYGSGSHAPGASEKAQVPRLSPSLYERPPEPLRTHSMALEMLHNIQRAVRDHDSLGIPQWVTEVYPGMEDTPFRIPPTLIDFAKPYYVSSQVMDALRGPFTSGRVPDWSMPLDGVPTPAGFMWFDRAPIGILHPDVPVGSKQGMRWDMVALSWVTAWGRTDGRRRLDGTLGMEYIARPTPGYEPMFSIVGWFRDAWAPADYLPAPVIEVFYTVPGTDLHTRSQAEIYDGDNLNVGWWKVRGPMDLTQRVTAVFEVVQTFMMQTLLVTTERAADRQTRRRLDKSKTAVHPLVRVVELRRKVYAYTGPADPDREKREFSCQWPVEGHWHKFWLGPRNAENRPFIRKWVAGYIKGPSDKPFKGNVEKLYKIAR